MYSKSVYSFRLPVKKDNTLSPLSIKKWVKIMFYIKTDKFLEFSKVYIRLQRCITLDYQNIFAVKCKFSKLGQMKKKRSGSHQSQSHFFFLGGGGVSSLFHHSVLVDLSVSVMMN